MQKILADFIPLILFFVTYRFSDIYVATGVAIAASLAQLIYLKIKKLPIQAINYINVSIIVLFGGLTIALHDDTFIKLKPTILYSFFALLLLFGQFILKRNFLQNLMGKELTLPPKAWQTLLFSWVGFLVFMAVLNLYVAFWGGYSEAQWVSFKTWGLTILLIIFSIIQALYLSKYLSDKP